jgi:hypothetical protein
MQMDSIHKAVTISANEAFLCTTTACSKTLRRHVPIFATIMYGHCANHFEKHFNYANELR